MAPTEQSWTKTQLSVFFVLLLLTIDEINPIKLFLHVFSSVEPWHIAVVCVSVIVYIFVSDFKNLIYFGIKIFFHSILSIFFRQVEIIGRENIPAHGPVIFSVNHANQFMDAVCLMCTTDHKVSYLMAEASWKRRIIGDLAWALGVIPVKRAQDEARPGAGQVVGRIEDETTMTIEGTDTQFTKELAVGDKIRPPSTAFALKVTAIESDTKLVCDCTGIPDDFPALEQPVNYDILKYTPLNVVFGKVLDRLAANGAVGIFPEGGSHDRTDLLPLKVGVALIAYSALEKDGVNVPIVPVGLNYFRAHRWRGRAVIEYGRPILIDPSTLDDFTAGGMRRRKVCNQLLENIESSMRSVIVSTTDYESLELIHTARRLYQKGQIGAEEKQDLSRRFAEGYRRLLLIDKPPQEWLDLQERLQAYRHELRDLGLKDYQVMGLSSEHLDEDLGVENVDGDKVLGFLQWVYNIVHLLLLISLAAIPTLLLNLPVGMLAGLYAERRRVKALAKSKVKVRGFDVMLTEKVVFCLVMLPTLWIFYGAMMYCFTNLDGPTIALALLSMPLFAYIGIIVTEAGMIDWQDLRPYCMRIFPSTRKRLLQLPGTRKKLQEDLRAFIKSIGPALGEIYYSRELDWKLIQEKSRQAKEKKNT